MDNSYVDDGNRGLAIGVNEVDAVFGVAVRLRVGLADNERARGVG